MTRKLKTEFFSKNNLVPTAHVRSRANIPTLIPICTYDIASI